MSKEYPYNKQPKSNEVKCHDDKTCNDYKPVVEPTVGAGNYRGWCTNCGCLLSTKQLEQLNIQKWGQL